MVSTLARFGEEHEIRGMQQHSLLRRLVRFLVESISGLLISMSCHAPVVL
jgi:hypothetical protein